MRNIETYAEKYLESNFEEYQSKYRKKAILDILNHYRPYNILEIGCGMDPIFQYIKYEHAMTIIEPSNIFYQNAQKIAENSGHNVKCICDFFENANLEKEKYDFILCSSLLHEIENPCLLLENIYKIADENTTIHINVPNANSLHRLVAVECGIIKEQYSMSERNILLQQNTVYDLNLFKNLVINSGFEILDSGSYFVKPFTHEQMSRMLEANIIDEKVLEGLYNIGKYLPEYGSEIFVNAKKKDV